MRSVARVYLGLVSTLNARLLQHRGIFYVTTVKVEVLNSTSRLASKYKRSQRFLSEQP
jgi:hypothetical protein